MKKTLYILLCILLSICACSCSDRDGEALESRVAELEELLSKSSQQLDEANEELGQAAVISNQNKVLSDEVEKLKAELEAVRASTNQSYDIADGRKLVVKYGDGKVTLTEVYMAAAIEQDILEVPQVTGISIAFETGAAAVNTGDAVYVYGTGPIEKLQLSCLPDGAVITDAYWLDDEQLIITAYTELDGNMKSGRVYIYETAEKEGRLLIDTAGETLSIRRADLYTDAELGPQLMLIEMDGYDSDGNADNLYYYYLGAADIYQLLYTGDVLTIYLN